MESIAKPCLAFLEAGPRLSNWDVLCTAIDAETAGVDLDNVEAITVDKFQKLNLQATSLFNLKNRRDQINHKLVSHVCMLAFGVSCTAVLFFIAIKGSLLAAALASIGAVCSLLGARHIYCVILPAKNRINQNVIQEFREFKNGVAPHANQLANLNHLSTKIVESMNLDKMSTRRKIALITMINDGAIPSTWELKHATFKNLQNLSESYINEHQRRYPEEFDAAVNL